MRSNALSFLLGVLLCFIVFKLTEAPVIDLNNINKVHEDRIRELNDSLGRIKIANNLLRKEAIDMEEKISFQKKSLESVKARYVNLRSNIINLQPDQSIEYLSTRLHYTPKKTIIEGDTLVSIALPSVDTINALFVDIDGCNEANDSLYAQIENQDKLREKQKEIILNQAKQISLGENIISEKDSIIDNQKEIIDSEKKKSKRLKIQRTILIGIASILGALVIL